MLSTDENGVMTLRKTFSDEDDRMNATKATRISSAYQVFGGGDDFKVDYGYTNVVATALRLWDIYPDKGGLSLYDGLLTSAESAQHTKILNYMYDTLGQSLPDMIKNGLGGWDTFVKKVNKLAPEKITAIYQKYVDQ
jgi:hypothetical protein